MHTRILNVYTVHVCMYVSYAPIAVEVHASIRYVCMYLYIYVYAHTHISVYLCTHTHIHTFFSCGLEKRAD